MALQNFTSGVFGGLPGGVAPQPPLPYPARYTLVSSAGPHSPGKRTTVHAVLDYDDDEETEDGAPTPEESEEWYQQHHQEHQQGPLLLKNGTVPVVPVYALPQHYNGTLVQIPILWTALSLALGLEIRGDIIRGAPCIKRYHQLFCPTAGTHYPIDRIELFIDENKALMKRMYGEFQTNSEYGPPGEEVFESQRNKRGAQADHQGPVGNDGAPSSNQTSDTYFGKLRSPRQSQRPPNGSAQQQQQQASNRMDACQSKVEIVTPYWAANSAGKVRAIVNTQHFEQAIHQEVCVKVQTGRCSGDCGCEQKYKWHRLLAYDPDNDCKGIFMDWFLFPSCCVCRCDN